MKHILDGHLLNSSDRSFIILQRLIVRSDV